MSMEIFGGPINITGLPDRHGLRYRLNIVEEHGDLPVHPSKPDRQTHIRCAWTGT